MSALHNKACDFSRGLFTWLIRIVLFVILLALAAANTQDATLNFFTDLSWQAPLILIGLAFFVAGILVSWLFTLPTYFRRKFEIRRLKRELKQARETSSMRHEPPTPR